MRLVSRSGKSFFKSPAALYCVPIIKTGFPDFFEAIFAMYYPAVSGGIPVCSSFSIFSTEREILPP